ncbi:7992_t:CDS:2 [Cetraspora pellucida]|uniref:7992_t:CDS:1 n=1 Tax=Cetraspora pellucida TaxID=1433469 RepID=A0ACA9K7X6_9GLOM|nr:7992_t:CDS:2 [Cetraspora pellucida]
MPKVERDTGNKNRITPYHSTPRHIEQVVLSGAKKSTLSPPKDRLISNPFDEPLMPLTKKEIMDLLRSEELLDPTVRNDKRVPHGKTELKKFNVQSFEPC